MPDPDRPLDAPPDPAGDAPPGRVAEAVPAEPPAPDAPGGLTPLALRRYVGRGATVRLITLAARRMLGPRATKDAVDEVLQQTVLLALEAREGPRSIETADGWLVSVAHTAAHRSFRKQNLEGRRMVHGLTDQALHAAMEVEARDAEGWSLDAWLERHVEGEEDRALLALLQRKARDKLPHKELAKDLGISENALSQRIGRFRVKYDLLRHRGSERRRTLAWWLFALVVGGLALWLVLHMMAPAARPEIVPIPSAAPAPVLSPTPAPFEPALPTPSAPPSARPRLPDKPVAPR